MKVHRDIWKNQAARVEDIRSAVDYLTTLSYIDEERIGVLGVCAGGGYAVNAANDRAPRLKQLAQLLVQILAD